MKIQRSTIGTALDNVCSFCACAFLFGAAAVCLCVFCPPDPPRHAAGHVMPIQTFAKTTLRAGRL